MEEPKKRNVSWVVAIVAVIIVALLLLLVAPTFNLGNIFSPKQSTSTFVQNPSGNSVNLSSNVDITYPSNYAALANYSLSIINENRTSQGFEPGHHESDPLGAAARRFHDAEQSTSATGTRRASSLHQVPLLNGTGFVEENIAYEYSGFPSFKSTQSVERAIAELEWQMMNNDSACCSNGHRDNILNQFHNRVSIGIAYSSTYIYFVEDFETYLVTLNTPISQGNSIILEGNSSAGAQSEFCRDILRPDTGVANSKHPEQRVQHTIRLGRVRRRCRRTVQQHLPELPEVQPGHHCLGINLAGRIKRNRHPVLALQFRPHRGNRRVHDLPRPGEPNSPDYLTSISVFVTN